MKTILVVGGTGAQGSAVVSALVTTGKYHILLFTRDMDSPQCQRLLSLNHVEAVMNPAIQGYDLAAFETAARNSYGVFLNTDGFSIGEQAEMYWGMRLYETAVKARVQHVVYSGLDDNYRNSDYNDDYYVGHFQAKARVQGEQQVVLLVAACSLTMVSPAFITAQPSSRTAWTITHTGLYMEMLSEALIPTTDADGLYSFSFPLNDGEIIFLHLQDHGRYLGIGVAHSSGQDIADAFTKTTNKPAAFRNIPIAAWCAAAFSRFPDGADTKIGFRSVREQSMLGLTYGENFTKFWNLFKASKGNTGLIKRDYELLDEILPDRVRSVQGWMERTGYTGERIGLLKEW